MKRKIIRGLGHEEYWAAEYKCPYCGIREMLNGMNYCPNCGKPLKKYDFIE